MTWAQEWVSGDPSRERGAQQVVAVVVVMLRKTTGCAGRRSHREYGTPAAGACCFHGETPPSKPTTILELECRLVIIEVAMHLPMDDSFNNWSKRSGSVARRSSSTVSS